MSKITCQNCGAKQTTNRRSGTCISCGKELNFNDIERAEMLDGIFHFHPTAFTRAVTIASVIIPAANLIAIIVLVIQSRYNAGLLIIPMIVSLIILWSCTHPLAAYKLYMLSSRRSRTWLYHNSADIDDPYHKDVVAVVYKRSVVYLTISVACTLCYFLTIGQYAI